jgi:hypothetical protein
MIRGSRSFEWLATDVGTTMADDGAARDLASPLEPGDGER